MSQRLVLEILQDIGEGRSKDIAEEARKRYPNTTLHKYVSNPLNKLEKRGEIEKVGNIWRIPKKEK